MLKGDRCFSPKCAVERRGKPPGKTTASSRRRISDRGVQLREKQKVRYTYEVMEKQFRRYFAEAIRLKGVTSDNLFVLLERRLDSVIYRLGWSDSRSHARQLVQHGLITLNGRKTNIPSALVKEGDNVGWTSSSTKTEYFKGLIPHMEGKIVPGWLTVDKDAMVGRIVSLPSPTEVGAKFSGKAIVEYYSR